MTSAEQGLLAAAAEGRQRVLEFGCGGSTVLMLESGVGQLLSVDSDAVWLRRVAGDAACAPAVASGRLKLCHVDLGPPGAWGFPQDPALLPRWPSYWRDPWIAMPAPHLVLVDGRFRVACALQAAVLAPAATVAVHDFFGRPHYRQPLLRHFEIVDAVDELAILAARLPLDPALLAADCAAFAFDPR